MVTFNKKTDKIAIIAPASSCDEALGKLKKATELLANQGFSCRYDLEIFKSDQALPFFASSRENRLKQFESALLDNEVKIIWAFRGGYGSSEIAFDLIKIKPSSPKILIGFSDITTLHFLFNQHYGLQTIHGPVITALIEKQASMLLEIISVLEGKNSKLQLIPLNSKSSGPIEGKVIGGNLTMICNMIGTELHPKTNGTILFLEDVNEKGYQIHRHLLHMKNAGLFNGVKAIIFGDFTESDHSKDAAIKDFYTKYLHQIPVFHAHGIGHGGINHPITIGGEGKITEDYLVIHNNNFALV